VGVWGLGPHAIGKVLPALGATRHCVLAGVTTRNPSVLAEVATRFGCRAWRSPNAMLEDSEVDAIYLATPTGLHDDHVREILAARKHVWCEKSLTHDPWRSLSLVTAARTADLALCEAFMYVHHPQFARLREVLAQPTFGEIASATIRFGLPDLARPGFRYDPALGGGAFLDVGCYLIHFVAELFGAADVVYARFETLDRRVDVRGRAELVLAAGGHAFLEWGYGLAYRNEAFVWGTTSAVSVESAFSKRDETRLVITDQTGGVTVERIAATNAFVAMFDVLAATARDRTARELWWRAAERQAQAMARVASAANLNLTPSPRPSTG